MIIKHLALLYRWPELDQLRVDDLVNNPHLARQEGFSMTPIAVRLARWACDLEPAAADIALASRSLRDTVAVAIAAREHPVTRLAGGLPDGARWAVAGHVL